MFERFEDSSRRVLTVAQEMAREHKACVINPGHLLLAILDLEGPAAKALSAAKVDQTLIKESFNLAEEGVGFPRNFTSFHRDSKKVLELALRECLYRGDKSISTIHLLLGLCRLRPTPAIDWDLIRSNINNPEMAEDTLTNLEITALAQLNDLQTTLGKLIQGPEGIRVIEHLTSLRYILAQNVTTRLFPEIFRGPQTN